MLMYSSRLSTSSLSLYILYLIVHNALICNNIRLNNQIGYFVKTLFLHIVISNMAVIYFGVQSYNFSWKFKILKNV